MAVTRAIELRTEIPGPRSREITERKERVVADPLGLYLPIVIADGRGATVTDVDGNSFVDFAGGVGCLNVGHAHPRVVAAVQEQAARFFHTDFTIVPYEIYVEYAERLTALAPFSGPTKAAFFNAGTEAVENAVKFARGYTRRPAVIGFEGAFHGRTLLSLTLTSKTHPYKAGLGPFAPEVYRVPFPDEYRGITARDALEALERALSTQVAAETVAAVVVEPVQGEGGFIPAPPAFLEGLRAICHREGILLVVDEVQSGFGRTGRMFAVEHYGVEPDLITVAKSMAAGLPLSAVVGKAEIMDSLWDNAVGGTYVGNPVALAAAVAVLDVFEEEGLVERAQHIGDTIRGRMLAWQERFDAIGDVRGLGAMLAVEYVEDRGTKEPAPGIASRVAEEAAVRGLLLLKAGIHSNCNRVLCPLVITDAELEEGLGAWRAALEVELAMAEGVALADGHGLVHRDVKPQNVLLNREGEIKVTDFGIARSLHMDHGVTQTGTVLGTGEYLAPEQASGKPVSAATDVYSLGVVLWELLAGDVPFVGENFVAVALRHVNEPAPSLHERRPDVSPRLDAAVARALAKDPAHRFPSMTAFAQELRACLAEVEGDAPSPPDDDPAMTLVTPPTPARRAERPRTRSRRRPFVWVFLALVAAGAAFAAVFFVGGAGHHSGGPGGGGGPSGSAVQ